MRIKRIVNSNKYSEKMESGNSDQGDEEYVDGYKSNDDNEDESIGDLDGF